MVHVDLLCKNMEWQTSYHDVEKSQQLSNHQSDSKQIIGTLVVQEVQQEKFGLIELELTKLDNEPMTGPEDKCAVCLLPSRIGI